MQETAFTHRGFMLDVSRHYMPPADIRKLLQAAAGLGLNVMHWHLTDDQGWRIEIRKYPRLTEIGAVRGPTHFGGVSTEENNCGFYTQAEIRELVAFADSLGIGIIPEIEIPGHASAMLAAYPEYGCVREGGEPWENHTEISSGIFGALLCAGKESSFRFMADILDEVVELFPYPAVHIGGDEAIKVRWRRCPDCRRKMRETGAKDEDDLQRQLVLRVGEYLAGKGKKTIVWNDVLAGGPLPPHFIVQQWLEGEERTREFMASGGTVICSDTRAFYLDYPYGQIDVRTMWEYPKIPEFAKGYERQLTGMECPLWTERVTNLDRAAYLLFPRLAALSLKMSEPADIPFDAFLEKVREMEKVPEALGLKGAPEEEWDLPEEAAEAERQAKHDSIFASDATPYVQQNQRLLSMDRAELLMRETGIPEAFALRAGDIALAEIFGGAVPEDPGGAADLARQMARAADSRRWGAWKDIPEEIWLDTMKCYARFIGEHRRACGYDAFDRASWTVRQAEARLFRIGELEYELAERDGKKEIGLHIPSDAKLDAGLLNESAGRARKFMETYFPDWAGAPVTCDSWLLSPALKEMLPPSSRILRFQAAFDLLEADPESDAAVEWVFHVAEEQRAGLDIRALPEETSLQRAVKARMLEGKHAGGGRGVLARRF